MGLPRHCSILYHEFVKLLINDRNAKIIYILLTYVTVYVAIRYPKFHKYGEPRAAGQNMDCANGNWTPTKTTTIVVAICACISVIVAFAGILPPGSVWIPWIRSLAATLIVLTMGLGLYGFFPRIGISLRRIISQTHTDDQEDQHRKVAEEQVGMLRSLSDVVASGDLDSKSGAQRAETLLRVILVRAQRIFEHFLPDQVVCTIKVPKSNGVFSCLYAPWVAPAKYDKFVKRFATIERKASYAGRALNENEIIAVLDLWGETTTREANPFSAEVARDLKEFGLQGIIVAPISVKNEPKLVFKVDVFATGFAMTPPLDRLLDFVCEACALVLQLAFLQEDIPDDVLDFGEMQEPQGNESDD